MNPHASPRRILAVWVAAMLCLVQGPVRADDTEIFLATPPANVNTKPNILFVIDTSGSMSTERQTQEPYNPNTTYSGSCTPGRIYWRSGTAIPDCTGNLKDQWVSDANFVCDSARAGLKASGTQVQASSSMWDGRNATKSKRKWVKPVSGLDSFIECKKDASIPHGDGTATGLYAADGSNGPFNSDKNQQIAWTTGQSATYTFFNSNYMNWQTNANVVNKTRMEVVQDAAKRTLDGLSDVNVALMRYSSNGQGGMVISEMEPIEDVRDAMKKTIDDLVPNGVTPLTETFYEAYLYYSGGTVDYGARTGVAPTPSIDASRLAADKTKYKSPIGSACQKNFIVYLTDGEPNQDQDADGNIEKLIADPVLNHTGGCTEKYAADGNSDGAVGDGRCFDDLAAYMYKKDFFNDSNADPKTGEATENIRTYTIGFGDGVSENAINLLRIAAEGGSDSDYPEGGGGKFYQATDTASLNDVFQNIIQFILEDTVSFTSPTVSVNAFNRTQNLNDLFITVFQPQETLHWPGNLKKYRLDQNGTIKDNSSPAAQDAVDPATGFFKSSATSFWSDVQDGTDVTKGGAAHEQPAPAARKVYTDISAVIGGATDLTAADNAVDIANVAITRTALGLPAIVPAPATDPQRDALIQWTRGADAFNTDTTLQALPRFQMGDPLHARPVSVIYGGTAAAKDLNDAVVYTATNDGFLHAVDPSDGHELWSFVPSELLSRMAALEQDDDTSLKGYGLDGSLRAFKLDKNNDGIVESGDKVYLFMGMGRGGSNYYALDVTDKNAPKFLWRHGAADSLLGLGQSWSTPVITQVNIGGAMGALQSTDKLVAIFAGGYDPTQDNITYNSDDKGNRLFMLDAVNGRLLWHAGPTSAGPGFDLTANFKHAKLVNSIPSDVRVLDMTNDGFADRMYVGDTGGQIWRFEIINGKTADELVTGGVIASLGALASGADQTVDNRRFYNAPDVSLLKADGRLFINLAIGSGYRGHPLNTQTHDRFYSVRDYQPFSVLTQDDYDTNITVTTEASSGFMDLTTNVNPTMPAGSPGWKIDLSAPSWRGEKVLAEARTFGGTVLFTTFTPASSSFTSCTATAGSNSLYAVSALDAKPFADRDGDSTVEAADRSGPLRQLGIAPEAVILFPSPDDPLCTGKACSPPPVCIVGVESCGVKFDNDPTKTFWMQKDAD